MRDSALERSVEHQTVAAEVALLCGYRPAGPEPGHGSQLVLRMQGPRLGNAGGEPIERVGLEAGVSSAWLARGLREAGLPAIVIDATHAAAALRTGFRNKTDRNDARGSPARR